MQNECRDFAQCADRLHEGYGPDLGDRALSESVLPALLEDDLLTPAERAFAQRDCDKQYSHVHTVEELSGNTDMHTLYQALCHWAELLHRRKNAPLSDAPISDAFAAFAAAYRRTIMRFKPSGRDE